MSRTARPKGSSVVVVSSPLGRRTRPNEPEASATEAKPSRTLPARWPARFPCLVGSGRFAGPQGHDREGGAGVGDVVGPIVAQRAREPATGLTLVGPQPRRAALQLGVVRGHPRLA